jgi:serine/threonine-protein kinase
MSNKLRLAGLIGAGLLMFALAPPAFAYGALAIQSSHGGAYGWSHDYSTKQDAEDEAQSECGDDCTVVLDFWNGCAAYSTDQDSGSTSYGWGIGNTQGEAEHVARRQCEDHGGGTCIIKVWACE